MTVTENGIVSPKANSPPSTGTSTVTVGEVLPTVIVVFADVLLPLESVTVRRAVYCPIAVYSNDGLGSIESIVPSPSKSHANVIESAGSGSFVPSLENWTVNGAGPSVGSASSTTTGERVPLTYANLVIAASGLMLKNPSP